MKKILKIVLYLAAIVVGIPILVLIIGFVGALLTKQVHFSASADLGLIPVDKPYAHSFCEPVLQKVGDICDSSATNPSNGKAPYHFELQSGAGLLPTDLPSGLTLNSNGLLTGIPNVQGKKKFGVCAIDSDGKQHCEVVTITIGDKSISPSTKTPAPTSMARPVLPLKTSPSANISWDGDYSSTINFSCAAPDFKPMVHSILDNFTVQDNCVNAKTDCAPIDGKSHAYAADTSNGTIININYQFSKNSGGKPSVNGTIDAFGPSGDTFITCDGIFSGGRL